MMPYVIIMTSMFGESVEMAKPNADNTAPNIDTGRHPNLFTRAPASGAVDTHTYIHIDSLLTYIHTHGFNDHFPRESELAAS